MARIVPEVLNLLACPVPECRGPLVQREAALACESCGRHYRSEERWPVLIPEEAVSAPSNRVAADGASQP